MKEKTMFIVLQSAQDEIAKYYNPAEAKPIRVFLANICLGPRIQMAFDEKRQSDKEFKINGLEFVVDKELLKHAHPIHVDFTGANFEVSTSLKIGTGCGGCEGSGSCG
jgi:iron-sulfur cluster assembly protein